MGYAADGYPIYYKYLYTDSTNANSGISAFQSSYTLKNGTRSGDGITAPNGIYDGTYVQDYEYISTLSELDECGGRFGVTPDYPNGTYYYVLTDNWPYIPRCLKGKYVDNSFRIGPNCPTSTATTDCSNTPTATENQLSEDINITIFPNPADDYVQIVLNETITPDKISSIKIYSANAVLIYYKEQYEAVISLGNVAKGIYFIQIDFGQHQVTQKIIIQ